MNMNVVAYTEKLMSIPSVSGNELPVLEYLSKALAESGFSVRHIPVGDGTYCIAATKGVSDAWIVGHVDTVPGVVTIETRDGKLYGRGSCDTKGNVAAAIVASESLKDINLLFTVGEEDTFRGARAAALDADVMQGKRFLILEPTSSEYMDGQRGTILVRVSAQGIQKHSALIENQSESAIHKVVAVLDDFATLSLPFFNVGVISGGMAKNIVAPECYAEIAIRPSTQKEFETTLQTLHDAHKRFIDVDVEIKTALEPLEGKRQMPGFTEAYFFRGEGREVAILGAGDLQVAHSPEEYVPITELEALPEKIRAWVENI